MNRWMRWLPGLQVLSRYLGRSRFLWTLDRKELTGVRDGDDDGTPRRGAARARWTQRKTEIVLRVIRGEAIDEPLYQGVRYAFGRLGKDVARGLTVRSDWGPQYTAHAFGAELRWLGIAHSPSFVGEPQCNGVIERFMRTLKEQCLWLHRFTDLAHAEREIGAFIERYNAEWLVERYGHCTPRAIRAKLQAAA